jgi:hypothetical protein
VNQLRLQRPGATIRCVTTKRKRDRDHRSREGSGRHRQPLIEVRCGCCGGIALARQTLPGLGLYVRTHFTKDGSICRCQDTVEEVGP